MSKTYKEAIKKGWKTRRKKYTKEQISKMMREMALKRHRGYKQEHNAE